MAAAAQAVLETLDPEAAGRARFEFSDEARRDWHYVPRRRGGIALGSLTPAQRAAVDRLLGATLSPQGQTKVHGIIELEGILGRLEGNPAFRDPELYHLAIFGDPIVSRPWGWRLEGHDLSLNVTSVPDLGVAPTPLFLGANPARVPDGDRAGWRVLARRVASAACPSSSHPDRNGSSAGPGRAHTRARALRVTFSTARWVRPSMEAANE